MTANRHLSDLWSPRDVEDLVVLAQVFAAAKRHGATGRRASGQQTQATSDVALACRRLTDRCALVPAPRAPGGYRASLIGIARLYRFVHAPVGIAPAMAVDREVSVRRLLLDVLAPPDRREVEARMCAELVELRAGIYRCVHADLCAGRGCPFELEVSADAIDRALCTLLPRGH